MRHMAVFKFTGDGTDIIFRALEPEVEQNSRTTVRLTPDETGALVMEIGASDLSALRAAVNTWLRLVMISQELQEM